MTRNDTRTHNEWFNTVMPKRKSCPTCKAKLIPNESVWGWYEYHNAKARLVKHFCRSCYPSEVRTPLQDHASTCRCNIELQTRGTQLPDWLHL